MITNFTLKEILTPEQYEFAEMIQELRTWYGKPFKVNSWTRTVKHNKEVGGDICSIHLDGRATDISVKADSNMIEKWKEICKKHNKIGGINLYKTFTHFDNFEEKYGHKSFVIRDYRKEK